MKRNIIKEKSYQFALKIIELSQKLNQSKHYVISKQILKNGTSIGANIEEGIGGKSRKGFRAKFFIAYKEARDTHYWLRLLKDSNFLKKKDTEPLIEDCHELKNILGSILVTLNKDD
jgi:four helix bundle protein